MNLEESKELMDQLEFKPIRTESEERALVMLKELFIYLAQAKEIKANNQRHAEYDEFIQGKVLEGEIIE